MNFSFDFLKKKRMSDSDLAQAMLHWQEAREALDVLEDAIKKEVLARQKTFQAGNVSKRAV